MDRISHLPDEIIHLLVGFLSAKDAARVLVLSKRFRNLFTVISDLLLNADEVQGRFTDHVVGVLALLESTTRIRRFSLKCRWGLDPAQINRWIRDVLKRGVMDLELCIYGDSGYELPWELFTCDTVVKMKLGSEFVISVVPRNASLPSLETLGLDSVQFEAIRDCALEAFLSACPALKELTIDGISWETWRWSGIVSSPTLERLTIGREFTADFDGPDHQSITFNTPSLAYFDYADFVADAYQTVDLGSLVEAKLSLILVVNHRWRGGFAYDGAPISSNPTNLIQGIRNVKILELSTPATFDALYVFRDAIPVFENLHHLTITNDNIGFCWRSLPVLLGKTPNLKTLIIKGELHYDDPPDDVEQPDYVCECVSGYSCLLSCPVEVLEITLWHNGTDGELEQVKHFLGNMSRLELLRVHLSRISAREKLRIITDLQRLPRASPNCEISFI